MTPSLPDPQSRTRWFLTFVLGGRTGVRLALTDFLLACLSLCLAFLLRFELELPAQAWNTLLISLPFVGLLRVGCFALFRLYRQILRFASMDALIAIFKGSALSTLLLAAGLFFVGRLEIVSALGVAHRPAAC